MINETRPSCRTPGPARRSSSPTGTARRRRSRTPPPAPAPAPRRRSRAERRGVELHAGRAVAEVAHAQVDDGSRAARAAPISARSTRASRAGVTLHAVGDAARQAGQGGLVRGLTPSTRRQAVRTSPSHPGVGSGVAAPRSAAARMPGPEAGDRVVGVGAGRDVASPRSGARGRKVSTSVALQWKQRSGRSRRTPRADSSSVPGTGAAPRARWRTPRAGRELGRAPGWAHRRRCHDVLRPSARTAAASRKAVSAPPRERDEHLLSSRSRASSAASVRSRSSTPPPYGSWVSPSPSWSCCPLPCSARASRELLRLHVDRARRLRLVLGRAPRRLPSTSRRRSRAPPGPRRSRPRSPRPRPRGHQPVALARAGSPARDRTRGRPPAGATSVGRMDTPRAASPTGCARCRTTSSPPCWSPGPTWPPPYPPTSASSPPAPGCACRCSGPWSPSTRFHLSLLDALVLDDGRRRSHGRAGRWSARRRRAAQVLPAAPAARARLAWGDDDALHLVARSARSPGRTRQAWVARWPPASPGSATGAGPALGAGLPPDAGLAGVAVPSRRPRAAAAVIAGPPPAAARSSRASPPARRWAR